MKQMQTRLIFAPERNIELTPDHKNWLSNCLRDDPYCVLHQRDAVELWLIAIDDIMAGKSAAVMGGREHCNLNRTCEGMAVFAILSRDEPAS